MITSIVCRKFDLESLRATSLCCFVALLGYEYWSKLELFGGVTIPKLVGLIYFSLALLSPKRLFSINNYNKIPLVSLFLLWSWLLFASLITYILYDAEFQLQTTFLQLIVLFWLVTNEVRLNPSMKDKLFLSFILGVFSIYVLMTQGIGIQASKEGGLLDDADNISRLWFMGLNPNRLGNLAALSFIMSLYLLFYKAKDNKIFYLLVLPMVSFPLLVQKSGSAGAFLLFFMSIAMFFLLQKTTLLKKALHILIGFLLFVLLLNFFSSGEYLFNKVKDFLQTGNTTGRTEIWLQTIDLIAESPLLGVGDIYRTAHNVFLDIFKWGGAVGLLLFLFFCCHLFWRALLNHRRNWDPMPLILWVGLMFILVKSGGGLNLKYVWLLLAMIVVVGSDSGLQKNKIEYE